MGGFEEFSVLEELSALSVPREFLPQQEHKQPPPPSVSAGVQRVGWISFSSNSHPLRAWHRLYQKSNKPQSTEKQKQKQHVVRREVSAFTLHRSRPE